MSVEIIDFFPFCLKIRKKESSKVLGVRRFFIFCDCFFLQMTERLIILFLLSLIVTNYEADSVIVTEVRAGNLAELPCPSNDDRHRFMFWQLADENIIIGPGNPIDQEKYNYEVLTGKLLIRVRN